MDRTRESDIFCPSSARTAKNGNSSCAHFSNWLFALHYLPTLDATVLTNEVAVYNSLYRHVEPLPIVNRSPSDKISFAYVALNFSDSSAALFYEALLTD